MTAAGPEVSFVAYSRWSLRRNGDLGRVLEVFKDVVRPAYAEVPGCLELTLLDLVDSQDYLVIAGWDTRDDYDAWVRQGEVWRAKNAEAFKQWQAVMEYEEEFQASIVSTGAFTSD